MIQIDSKWTSAGKVLALKSDFKAVGLNNVGTTAPSSPEEGEGWYDSTDHFILWYDGSGWNAASTFIGATAPTTPVEGLFMYDTDDNTPQVYNGATWDELLVAGGGSTGQSELSTDTEEETADIVTDVETIFTFSSVGSYGFYPQVKFEASTSAIEVKILGDAGGDGPTSYTTSIFVYHNSGAQRNCYVQIRYVTACGEILWLFILKDKETGKYIRIHKSPDHPCICCQNVDAVHHPFYDAYKPQEHELMVITFTKEERQVIEDLREWKNEQPQLTFLETVKKYFTIDEDAQGLKWPDIPVTIGLDRKRKEIKAKIPKRDYIKHVGIIRNDVEYEGE